MYTSVFPEEGYIPDTEFTPDNEQAWKREPSKGSSFIFCGNSRNKRFFLILLPTVLNHFSLENISVISYIIHKLYGQAILLISPNGIIQPRGRQGVSQ